MTGAEPANPGDRTVAEPAPCLTEEPTGTGPSRCDAGSPGCPGSPGCRNNGGLQHRSHNPTSSPGSGTGTGSGTATGAGGAGQMRPGQVSTQPPTPAPVTPGLADPGPDIVTGARTGTFVALTFHGAGDLALTGRALTVAHDNGATFSVFTVGQWLAANPTVGRDITGAGHDLGNHTWSHQPMTYLNQAEATWGIQLGSDAVSQSVESPGLLFRPSGTPTSTPTIRAAANACGYQRCTSYDVDPLDYTDPGADLVRTRVLAAVQPGSIVSLHLGYPSTIDALPGLLQGLTARGLTCVTLTRLLTAAT